MWPISSRLAHGTMVSRQRAPPSGSSVCLTARSSSCARELTIAWPFRLRPLEGHADAGHRPRVQDLPHVRDDQHRRHGRVRAPHPRDEGPQSGGDGHHLRGRLCGQASGGHRAAGARCVVLVLLALLWILIFDISARARAERDHFGEVFGEQGLNAPKALLALFVRLPLLSSASLFCRAFP